MSIDPRNLSAQLHHRAAGNPPSTLPVSAISNCFPGLEFDFRNLWRRIFDDIELHEASGFVTSAQPPLERLAGRYLLQVGDAPVFVELRGPRGAVEDTSLGSAFLEWSNALAEIVQAGPGATVEGQFYDPATDEVEVVELRVAPIFVEGLTGRAPVVDEAVAQPGELTQSLCSPWQNDYRECGCYYWAASRPDYVNVETDGSGASVGHNWLDRDRSTSGYQPEFLPPVPPNPAPRPNPQLIDYEELFRDWQGLLRFVVGGRDVDIPLPGGGDDDG